MDHVLIFSSKRNGREQVIVSRIRLVGSLTE